ncbi:MAG: antibiotic biosynthesis monooxygenase [Deltaproteobacteria bacterium RBG_16_47_11]|nr:MAG: antibiotic biosynthesis monooxygenase [Deltaproteobacteria bacterium RBG_16_47_11]
MAPKKLTVIAVITAKSGMESQTKLALEALVTPTRAEKGCINFDLYQATDNGCLFMFFENWTSKEALDEHMQAPHIKAFGAKAADLLAEPVKASFWEQIL